MKADVAQGISTVETAGKLQRCHSGLEGCFSIQECARSCALSVPLCEASDCVHACGQV